MLLQQANFCKKFVGTKYKHYIRLSLNNNKEQSYRIQPSYSPFVSALIQVA